MRVTCICVCHDKPDITHEAIGSIVNQTHADWEAIIIDSGVLFDAGYYERFAWRSDSRIRLIRSHETEETRRTKAMAPWCFNECVRKGWVSGELIVYLCDDDLLYPNAFQTFVSYWQEHPDVQAMYASQDLGIIYPNGWHAITGERRARQMRGRSCNGGRMDCEVDYLQFCHRTEVLKRFANDEYWPEARATEEHADGIFMERVGALTPIHPIDVKVSQNRRTPRSLNTSISPVFLMDSMANGIPLLPARETGMSSNQTAPVDELPLVTVAIAGQQAAAIREQTYPRIETIIIDDGPSQAAARNRALVSARGEYFLSIAANQRPIPEAVERLVTRMRTYARLSAVTCYLLGIEPAEINQAELQLQASVKNVTASALFRTADLRCVGGFDLESDAASGEWSTFFKLVNAGRHVDILPEHLFICAVDGVISTAPELLKPFVAMDRVLGAEREALWKAMAGYERRLDDMAAENSHLRARLELLRYRFADHVFAVLAKLPFVVRSLKSLYHAIGKMFARTRRSAAAQETAQPAVPLSWSAAKNASAAT